jgi:hypothetical protein
VEKMVETLYQISHEFAHSHPTEKDADAELNKRIHKTLYSSSLFDASERPKKGSI